MGGEINLWSLLVLKSILKIEEEKISQTMLSIDPWKFARQFKYNKHLPRRLGR